MRPEHRRRSSLPLRTRLPRPIWRRPRHCCARRSDAAPKPRHATRRQRTRRCLADRLALVRHGLDELPALDAARTRLAEGEARAEASRGALEQAKAVAADANTEFGVLAPAREARRAELLAAEQAAAECRERLAAEEFRLREVRAAVARLTERRAAFDRGLARLAERRSTHESRAELSGGPRRRWRGGGARKRARHCRVGARAGGWRPRSGARDTFCRRACSHRGRGGTARSAALRRRAGGRDQGAGEPGATGERGRAARSHRGAGRSHGGSGRGPWRRSVGRHRGAGSALLAGASRDRAGVVAGPDPRPCCSGCGLQPCCRHGWPRSG